ncbi:unnamed protein product [Lasius platythorax]|uniref:Uncharacterized protein n=1 Tax=Lasius platythorax TaxID=488582 RepID=A0AAV2N9F3_9HYME
MENENRYFRRRSVDTSHAAGTAVCDCIQYKSGESVLRRSRYVLALLPRGQTQALCARQDALTTRGMKLTRRNATSKIHAARLVVSDANPQADRGIFMDCKNSPSSL